MPRNSAHAGGNRLANAGLAPGLLKALSIGFQIGEFEGIDRNKPAVELAEASGIGKGGDTSLRRHGQIVIARWTDVELLFQCGLGVMRATTGARQGRT